MLELISLAKNNAVLVIGLFAVTFYLEGRIDSESDAIRQDLLEEFSEEFSTIRTEISRNGEEISILRQEVSILRQEVSNLRQEVSNLSRDVSELRQDFHAFELETTDRFARIETLLGQPAQ